MAASDWIKVRTVLPTDGRLRIASRKCHVLPVTVFGALVTLWCLADAHADENGVLQGYTAEDVDGVVSVPGFCAALPIDWIDVSGEFVKLPDYQEHNGTTGKTRAQDAKRQKRHRDVTDESRNDRDEKRTRGEERRGDQKQEAKASLPAGAGAPSCPHDAIVALYHEHLPANPRIKVWDGARADALRARWREDAKRQSPDYWQRFFAHVAASEFLTGKREGSNGRPFLPGLDWLVKRENFAKVIEGRYHDREAMA
jgi:hypothetical protein